MFGMYLFRFTSQAIIDFHRSFISATFSMMSSHTVFTTLCLDAAAESTDFHIIYLSDEPEDCSAGNATSSELVRRMREVIQMQSQPEPTINIGTITLPHMYITTCIYKLKKHSCLAGRYLKTNQ